MALRNRRHRHKRVQSLGSYNLAGRFLRAVLALMPHRVPVMLLHAGILVLLTGCAMSSDLIPGPDATRNPQYQVTASVETPSLSVAPDVIEPLPQSAAQPSYPAAIVAQTASLAAIAAQPASPAAIAATYHFLEFSDLHSIVENGEGQPVLSVLAANLKRREAENPGKTLILSGGDNVDGSEKILRKTHDAPIMEAMSLMGVDATAYGNNEYETYDIGIYLSETLKHCGFPVLCANILSKRTGEPLFEPYAIFPLEGLRVAVIGSSCYKIKERSLKKKEAPFAYVEHVEAIHALVAVIRAEDLADVILVLIHEGGTVDRQGKGGGTLFSIAEQLVGVDAVFGGDTHTVAQGWVNGIPVVVPGAYGQGYMDVTLCVASDGTRRFETRYVNLDTHEPEGYAGANPIRDAEVEAVLSKAGYGLLD